MTEYEGLMTELLPCPFCGTEVEVLTDGVRTWGLIEHREGCLFPVFPKHELAECDFSAWNTRAERTCEMNLVKMFPEHEDCNFVCWECSACKRTNDEQSPSYCPKCGAKVKHG